MKTKSVALCVLTVSFAFAAKANVLTDGQALTVGAGQAVEITGETATIPSFTDNGALTLKSGTALTVNGPLSMVAATNLVSASLMLESGSSLNFLGSDTGVYPTAVRFAAGRFGGTGTVTVASGAALTMTGARFNVAWNADSDAARVLPSFGRLIVAGAMTVSYLECAGYFVRPGNPPYDVASFPYAADICLEEGGVLAVRGMQFNGRTVSTIHFNGGTVKALLDNQPGGNPFFNGSGGMVNMMIADGKNAVVDTDGHNVVWLRNSDTNFVSFLTLTGTGGFVKKGAGSLALKLLPRCNTFTGPITVEAGVLSLGRPLAEGQTVTVLDGAAFVPFDAGDAAKIIYQDGGHALYVVNTNELNGLDLQGLSGKYCADRLGGPLAGASATLSGTVTHAEATVANPFKLIGLGSGTLTLQDTGLESIPALVSGIGTIAFVGNRTLTGAQNGYLQIDLGSTYQQTGSLYVSGTDEVARLTVTNSTFRVGGSFYIGGFGGTGAVSVANATLSSAMIALGSNTNTAGRISTSGSLCITNSTVSVSGPVFMGNFGLTTGNDRKTVLNTLELDEGSLMTLTHFYRPDDPRSKIIFNGGVVRTTETFDSFFESIVPLGILDITAPAGKNIIVDTQGNTTGLNANNGILNLTGDGGFIKRGVGTLGFGSSSTIKADYAGDTVVEAGTLKLTRANIIPDGSGKGVLRLNSGTVFDVGGCRETLNVVQGMGIITNSATLPVELGVGVDGRTWMESMTYNGNISLRKLGTGTMTLASRLHSGLTVAEGSVIVQNAANSGFRHYRFKVENVKNPSSGVANSMQFSEIKLLNDGTDVTGLRSGIRYDTAYSDNLTEYQTYPGGESFPNSVDGSLATKYLDFRAAASRSATDRARVWIEIDYAAPQRVTHYTWATANDGMPRDPSAWRFQGSVDGTVWTDLSIVTNYYATDTRMVWVGTNFPCAYSFAMPAGYVDSGASVSVFGGTTLTLDNVKFTVGDVDNYGTIFLQNNAELVCASPANSSESFNPGLISGSGKLTVASSNEVVLANLNAYTGDTIVQSGTLRLASISSAKWFRVTFRKTRDGALMQLSEFALFDAGGARQNLNLTQVANGVAAADLAAGTFSCANAYPVNTSAEAAKSLFDGSSSTKWCILGLNLNDEADSSKWVTLTLRLADTANPIVSYLFTTGNDSDGSRNPVSWLLESSKDGVTWTALDDISNATTPAANLTDYNNGTPYFLSARLVCTNDAMQSIPLASVVEVRSNATLKVSGANALIGALRLDCAAGGGTVTIFNPAKNGTLYLLNAMGRLTSYCLPLTIGAVNGKENLHTWKVYVNGELKKQYQLIWKDGKLMLASAGTVVMLM